MSYTLVLFEYLSWHYGAGIKEFLRAWVNIHWFWYHFFSVQVLLRTFFKPFHRMRESYGRGFNPQQYLETLIVNMMMRAVGMAVRACFLAIGLLAQAFTLAAGAVFFTVFLLSPALIPAGILLSFFLMFG